MLAEGETGGQGGEEAGHAVGPDNGRAQEHRLGVDHEAHVRARLVAGGHQLRRPLRLERHDGHVERAGRRRRRRRQGRRRGRRSRRGGGCGRRGGRRCGDQAEVGGVGELVPVIVTGHRDAAGSPSPVVRDLPAGGVGAGAACPSQVQRGGELGGGDGCRCACLVAIALEPDREQVAGGHRFRDHGDVWSARCHMRHR
ncbi:MAG: hypothetical protein GEV08_01360 [Acidimicrobiia bacterium]|nr:hypothetical protein [Acidimicrobiia bacterium]